MTRWIASGLGLPALALMVAARPLADPIAKLRAQAHSARRDQVELLLKEASQGKCGDLRAAAAVVRRLADEVAAKDGPAAGTAWAAKWALALHEMRQLSRNDLKFGKKDALQEALAHVEADLDLARRRGATHAALAGLYKYRLEVLTDFEKLTEAAVATGSAERTELLGRRAARLDAEAELAALEASFEKDGK